MAFLDVVFVSISVLHSLLTCIIPVITIINHNKCLFLQAKEQIRLAEEVKITKEKIKEVEEEWQSNLLNWKSKRKVNHGSLENEDEGNNTGDENGKSNPRKVKTFSEILNEKAKSGQRIGYNLHRYGYEDEEDDDISSLIRSNNNDNNSTNDSKSLILFL